MLYEQRRLKETIYTLQQCEFHLNLSQRPVRYINMNTNDMYILISLTCETYSDIRVTCVKPSS